jgi:hypothetical protein
MTEFHPPMTGVEEKFEEELGTLPTEKELKEGHFREEEAKPPKAKWGDAEVEEAMHLDQ